MNSTSDCNGCMHYIHQSSFSGDETTLTGTPFMSNQSLSGSRLKNQRRCKTGFSRPPPYSTKYSVRIPYRFPILNNTHSSGPSPFRTRSRNRPRHCRGLSGLSGWSFRYASRRAVHCSRRTLSSANVSGLGNSSSMQESDNVSFQVSFIHEGFEKQMRVKVGQIHQIRVKPAIASGSSVGEIGVALRPSVDWILKQAHVDICCKAGCFNGVDSD